MALLMFSMSLMSAAPSKTILTNIDPVDYNSICWEMATYSVVSTIEEYGFDFYEDEELEFNLYETYYECEEW